MRYLPYALRKVQDKLGKEDPVNAAKVTLANGTLVPLNSLNIDDSNDLWALLNIPADHALSLRTWFIKTIGEDKLNSLLALFDVQHAGMRGMPGKDPVYIVPASCHYSWPKAGALIGVGQTHEAN